MSQLYVLVGRMTDVSVGITLDDYMCARPVQVFTRNSLVGIDSSSTLRTSMGSTGDCSRTIHR